jgi:hypothetical protein
MKNRDLKEEFFKKFNWDSFFTKDVPESAWKWISENFVSKNESEQEKQKSYEKGFKNCYKLFKK